jgi:putative glutathione S-transferase
MGTDGWPFAPADPFPDADADPLYDSRHVKDLYLRADPAYSGRFTVPVLWDKKRNTIVNNESSEIIRILNTEFNALVPAEKAQLDFYPAPLRADIDGVNEWVYGSINSASFYLFILVFLRSRVIRFDGFAVADGVYKAGFAKSQEAYQDAVVPLFESLDRVEAMLKDKTYLVGDRLTEADIRLYVTIVRSRSPDPPGRLVC